MSTCTALPVLTMTRILNASRERVFDAWTKPELITRWFGPTMDSTTHSEIDLRSGGKYTFRVQNPERETTVFGEYKEVVPPSRLVFTWNFVGFEEANGSIVTVELKDLGGKTEITVTHAQLPNEHMFQAHQKGWTAGLDKMGLIFDPNANVDTTSMTNCPNGA